MFGSYMKPYLSHRKSHVSKRETLSGWLALSRNANLPIVYSGICLLWMGRVDTGKIWIRNLNISTLQLTHRNGSYSGFRSYLQFHLQNQQDWQLGNSYWETRLIKSLMQIPVWLSNSENFVSLWGIQGLAHLGMADSLPVLWISKVN